MIGIPNQEMQILLVEDSEPDIFLFRRALRSAGIKAGVTVFRTGEEASHYLKDPDSTEPSVSFDLAVLDLNLPGENGLSVLGSIRQHPTLRNIPVAILTSSESPREKQEAARLGADRFLIKPYGIEGLGAITDSLKGLMAERAK